MSRVSFGITFLANMAPDVFVDLAKYVDTTEIDFFWAADAGLYGRYVYNYLTLAAVNTKRVRIGPNCTHPLTRHPAVNFNALTSLDEISRGRAVMNIGAGGGTLKELGYTGAKLAQVRDMIEQGRALLTGKPVTFSSPLFELKGASLRELFRNDMPIFMTASGPKMLALAGELCDGVVFMAGADPACIQSAISDIAQGADRANRDPSSIDRGCLLFGNLNEDREEARSHCRAITAWTISTQPRYVALAGIPTDRAEEIRKAFSGSAHGPEAERAAAMVTDEMIDKFTLAGNARDFIATIERIVATGINHIEFFPEGGDARAMTRLFAEAVVPHFTRSRQSDR